MNANFDDGPPLLKLTNSIDIKKGNIKSFVEDDIQPFQQPRMLKTPCLDNNLNKRNKVVKIKKERKETSKTPSMQPPSTKQPEKVQLNPSINFKHGIAPALTPAMMRGVLLNKKKYLKPRVFLHSELQSRQISPMPLKPLRLKPPIYSGLFSPQNLRRHRPL